MYSFSSGIIFILRGNSLVCIIARRILFGFWTLCWLWQAILRCLLGFFSKLWWTLFTSLQTTATINQYFYHQLTYRNCEKFAHCNFLELKMTFANVLFCLTESSKPKNIQYNVKQVTITMEKLEVETFGLIMMGINWLQTHFTLTNDNTSEDSKKCGPVFPKGQDVVLECLVLSTTQWYCVYHQGGVKNQEYIQVLGPGIW